MREASSGLARPYRSERGRQGVWMSNLVRKKPVRIDDAHRAAPFLHCAFTFPLLQRDWR